MGKCILISFSVSISLISSRTFLVLSKVRIFFFNIQFFFVLLSYQDNIYNACSVLVKLILVYKVCTADTYALLNSLAFMLTKAYLVVWM